MQLANRIRKIREAHKLTQEDVASRCDISSSAYGQIERKAGNSSYETLCKVAKALNVSVLFLLDIDNQNYLERKNKL
jgi:transcriptional regulator with XRE-family HTH domain